MKCITWNVNGLRSVMGKGFAEFVGAEQPDMVLLQETKVKAHELDWAWLNGYELLWHPAGRPGYSGTGILTRHRPLAVARGIGIRQHDGEGRVLTAEFPGCYVVSVYTPNARAELVRLPYRMTWDKAFLTWLRRLEKSKPVLVAGDFNVAHKEIDIARPAANRRNPGFTDEERAGFEKIVRAGFVDVFRSIDPAPHRYTWWSYRAGARGKNIGWRIDYWLASHALLPHVRRCTIRPEITGSDHCPVVLEMNPEFKL